MLNLIGSVPSVSSCRLKYPNFFKALNQSKEGEQVYIRFYNAADSLLKNSATIAKLGLATTGTAILTQTLVTAASYALDLYRGDITVEEFKDRIVEAAVSAGIAAPVPPL
jgi:hypothetical protein